MNARTHDPIDTLLKHALSPETGPSASLNERVKQQLAQPGGGQAFFKRRWTAVAAAAVLTLALSAGAMAASHLLKAQQVAQQLGDPVLAAAFATDGAIELNETAESGDYRFTLLGMVSGSGLSGFSDDGTIAPEKTYAVVAIAKRDGSAMPSTADDAYDEVPFFVTPLIKGQEPWRVNIATMGGGYGAFVVDGVMYRLVEFDDIGQFANRGVYLGISTSTFFDRAAFHYDAVTGDIALAPGYSGAHALFDLPLDVRQANPVAAQQYLDELLAGFESPANNRQESPASEDVAAMLGEGTIVPESVERLSPGSDGMVHYEFDNFSLTIDYDALLQMLDDHGRYVLWTDEDGVRTKAMEMTRDGAGDVIGRVYTFD